MDIIKYILKIALFISLVLAFGQIQMGDRSLGGHFVSGVGSSSRWAGRQIITSKWLSGIQIPEFITKWLNSEGQTTKKRRTQNDEEGQENISKSDREAMLRLLKE